MGGLGRAHALGLGMAVLMAVLVASAAAEGDGSDWGLTSTLTGLKGEVDNVKRVLRDMKHGPDVRSEDEIAAEQEGGMDSSSNANTVAKGNGRHHAMVKLVKSMEKGSEEHDKSGATTNTATDASSISKRWRRYPHVPKAPNSSRSNYDSCFTYKPNWGHWNYRGWQNCPSGTYQTGWYRGGCDKINCIDGINCCRPKNQPDQHTICYAQNMWSRFDHRGWHHCDRPGYFLNGWWKNSGRRLYHIENFHCCKPKWSEPKYDSCYTENWWGSLDRRGWSTCRRPNHFIRGIYRNSCSHLHCLEMAHCCTPTYPRPATDRQLTRSTVVAFPGTAAQRGRIAVSSGLLRNGDEGHPVRITRGYEQFKSAFFGRPEVTLTLSMMDTLHSRNQRVDVYAERVHDRGFWWRVQTWGDSVVYGVHVDWLAVGRDAGAYVADRKNHYKIRVLLHQNAILQKVQYHVYARMVQLQRRVRAFHRWALVHNMRLRKARQQMKEELNRMIGRSVAAWKDIEKSVKFCKRLRAKVENDMKSVGVVPNRIKKAWNFAKKTKKWASRTLLRMKKKSTHATNLVRTDMTNVWNSNREIDQEVTLSIMELERDLQQHIRMKSSQGCDASSGSCGSRRDIGGGPGSQMFSSAGHELPYGSQLGGGRGYAGLSAAEMNEKPTAMPGDKPALGAAPAAKSEGMMPEKSLGESITTDGLTCKCMDEGGSTGDDGGERGTGKDAFLQMESTTSSEDEDMSLDDLEKTSSDPAEMPGLSMLDAAGASDTLAQVNEDGKGDGMVGSATGDGAVEKDQHKKNKSHHKKSHRHHAKGKRKCVCVQSSATGAANSSSTSSGAAAAAEQPVVMSLLFEEGVAIPPGIRVVDEFPFALGQQQ